MTDTKPKINKMMADMMMNKTGVERLKMGLSMFDMAKRLVIVSILSSGKCEDMRKELFLRFYARDLEPKAARIILEKI